MYGLEAINHHHGWAISAIGVSIVFTVLVLLAFAISQLHKLVHFWENKDVYFKNWVDNLSVQKEPAAAETVEMTLTPSQSKEIVRQFNLLCKMIGQSIPLPELIKRAENRGLCQPYSSVNHLLQTKLLIPDGKGFYHWDQQAYDNIFPKE